MNNQDEHIECASCGTSFVFSAGEAAVFEQRGLTAPKRCKDCRRARKEQGQGQGRPSGGGYGDRGPRPDRAPHHNGHNGFARPQRYTGDVNEYRSPMQDTSARPYDSGRFQNGNSQDHRPARGRGPRDDGNYRAPSSHGRENGYGYRPPRDGNGYAPRPAFGGRPAEHAPHRHDSRPRDMQPGSDGGDRRRRPSEMYSITCNQCGAAAEVPFKPAEGRDIFCQTCYRARKPS